MDAFGKFQEVSQTCNMLQLAVEECGRVSLVCRYALTIISVKDLHKCIEISLTVTHIAVSLTLKAVRNKKSKFFLIVI